MKKKDSNLKVAIIGPYPPPYGGISIHVQRVHYHLQEKGIEHAVYTKTDEGTANLINISQRRKWLLKYFFTAKENILHFHSIDWRERVLVGLMGFGGRKVVLTIHGESLNSQISQSNWIKKKTLIWALRNIANIIVVNPKTKDLLTSLGIKSEKVKHIPAFIPPLVKDDDIEEIPQNVLDFIDTHKPVISANASKIVFYNNEDLYGIDMCIDVCANLKKYYPQIGFVFCLPDIGDYEYFHKMKQRVKEKEIRDNFLFQTKPCQLYPIIRKSDVFVRPTNTDGDAISLREALYFKIPSVASDAVPRPEGAILFRTRNIDDLSLKIKDVLVNYEQHKKKLEEINLENNFKNVMRVYQNLESK